MDHKEKTLGEQALACGMRWVKGMVEASGAVCVQPYEGAPWRWAVDNDSIVDDEGDDVLPDVEHPATQGCILAQASERWAASKCDHEPTLTIMRVQGGWCWLLEHVRRGRVPEQIAVACRGPVVPTYGEACVSALEGSPS